MLYLVTDAQGPKPVLVEARRMETALNAVIADRFTVSPVTPREAFSLGQQGVEIIETESQAAHSPQAASEGEAQAHAPAAEASPATDLSATADVTEGAAFAPVASSEEDDAAIGSSAAEQGETVARDAAVSPETPKLLFERQMEAANA